MISNSNGDFIWYELLTTSHDEARKFYQKVVGWIFGKFSVACADSSVDYREFSSANGPVGGVLELTAEMQNGGAQPCWLGYIAVDDVDKSVAKIKAAGGTLYHAWARHWDEETSNKHEEMGFSRGWMAVANQLAALAEAS